MPSKNITGTCGSLMNLRLSLNVVKLVYTLMQSLLRVLPWKFTLLRTSLKYNYCMRIRLKLYLTDKQRSSEFKHISEREILHTITQLEKFLMMDEQ
jgi:hypothetical protein